MDNLKTLMDKKEYDLVIKLTESALDVNDLFYRVSAFVATNKIENALEVIKQNREILKSRLSLLIKVHIETLCLLEKFDEAYKEMEYYQNLPYESQEVEEMLANIPKLIRMEEKKAYQSKTYSEEEIIKSLKSENSDTILIALDLLREREISKYLPFIENLLINYEKQSIRTFALLLLVSKRIDKIIKFKSIDKIIEINPKNLTPPFENNHFKEITNAMGVKFKDPSLAETAVEILSTYILFIYPREITDDIDILLTAIKSISMDYMNCGNDENTFNECKNNNLDLQKVLKLKAEIDEAMEKF